MHTAPPNTPTPMPRNNAACARRSASFALLHLAAFLASAAGACAGVGGGWTQAGLLGEYYANPGWTAPAAFVRRDVRIDFRANNLAPGGAGRSGDAAFRSVPAESFSVRWSGGLIPRFSETYQFTVSARDVAQVRLRPKGAVDWTLVIDQTAYPGGPTAGAYAMTAGASYDVEIRFAHGAGPWESRLRWSSPSTPDEGIDPLTESGINNPDWTAGFTDIVKGARNSWEPAGGGARPAMDADGWPMGDGSYVFQESLNQGLDLDPLMLGRIAFSFHGKASVAIQGNVRASTLAYSYNAASNLTTGGFIATNNGWNASFFTFTNARRNGQASGPPGITQLRLMRPASPGAASAYDPNTSLFTPQLLDAMGHFTVVRHQYVANQQRDWAERTLPSHFNQSGGSSSPPHYGVGGNSDNGVAWEIKVLLANESGRDLMLSIPTVASGSDPADATSYLWKLANLLRYGSDGVEPYAGPTADPVYPPLNSNLRIYLELENELWNWGGPFYVDWANINALAAADVASNTADFQAFNYDGLPTSRDGNGNYVSMNTWRLRKIALRLTHLSDIFRAVFGDDGMMSRVRPLYEWQYDNANDTARLALTFMDRYLNNGDGQSHVPAPHPVSHWLWGGGGATYYGAVNGNGLTTLLPDPAFAAPAFANPGYYPAPAGSAWTFSGASGIARHGTNTDIPPAVQGAQMAYLTDHGAVSTTVVFPTNFTSPWFGVSFKAVNRVPPGGGAANLENLRVYLDGTTDLTARTFSQGNGYTPPGYDTNNPWSANNVFWTHSQYYFTKSFQAAPGSTHTLTFRGRGDVNNAGASGQTAFIGEVRVTSVDRIFEDGIPGGGEAAGQPVGAGIRNTMNVEASWAKAFGLEQLSYEGGWSLGGDDGGSWVQLKAKYGDPRTATAQRTFMDLFYQAGSAVNVFGTYAQWPSWGDYYAEQGLLNPRAYPIVQGIDDAAGRLPAEPVNGVLIPASLGPKTATLSDQANMAEGQITGPGGWIDWNVIAPGSGSFSVSASLAAGSGVAVVLVDDAPLGGSLAGTAYLTQGLHSLKIRSLSKTPVTVSQLAVQGTGAPGAPILVSAVDGDGQAQLSWNPVAGASRYEVRFGVESARYTERRAAGASTQLTVTGLTNGLQYYFVVLAGDDHGFGLPSAERGLIPVGIGQPASLAVWEFDGAAGNETTAAAASSSSRVSVGALHRGSGLVPSTSDWAATFRAGRFGSEPAASQGHAYGATLAQAIAARQYYEFTIAAGAGRRLSLQQVAFRALFQGAAGGAGMTYSTNGTSFSEALPATGSPADGRTPWIVDLSRRPDLQTSSATITVRLYLYGLGAYQVSALGDPSGPDIVVTGAVRPVQLPLQIAPHGAAGTAVSWPDVGPGPSLQSKATLAPEVPWQPVVASPFVAGNRRVAEIPPSGGSLFFRLIE